MKPNTIIKNCLHNIANIESDAIYFKKNPSTDARIIRHLEIAQDRLYFNHKAIKNAKEELEEEAYRMDTMRDIKKLAREDRIHQKAMAIKSRKLRRETQKQIIQIQKETAVIQKRNAELKIEYKEMMANKARKEVVN